MCILTLFFIWEQMESLRLSEQKETLLKKLTDTEAENTVSFRTPFS